MQVPAGQLRLPAVQHSRCQTSRISTTTIRLSCISRRPTVSVHLPTSGSRERTRIAHASMTKSIESSSKILNLVRISKLFVVSNFPPANLPNLPFSALSTGDRLDRTSRGRQPQARQANSANAPNAPREPQRVRPTDPQHRFYHDVDANWAIYYHYLSNDEDPQHYHCPLGARTWYANWQAANNGEFENSIV